MLLAVTDRICRLFQNNYQQDDTCHLVGNYFGTITIMHGTMNVKFIKAKQAKELYRYRNIKRKLYKTNAAIWYNKTCRKSVILLVIILEQLQ